MIAILKYKNRNDLEIFAKEIFEYFYDIDISDKNILSLRYTPNFKIDLYNKNTGKLIGWEKMIEKFKTQLDKAEITIIETGGRYILNNS